MLRTLQVGNHLLWALSDKIRKFSAFKLNAYLMSLLCIKIRGAADTPTTTSIANGQYKQTRRMEEAVSLPRLHSANLKL